MKIKEFLSQTRRDFHAIFECEHCKHQVRWAGYDDEYFHQKVIPTLECPVCKKVADENYRGYAPKYGKDEIV